MRLYKICRKCKSPKEEGPNSYCEDCKKNSLLYNKAYMKHYMKGYNKDYRSDKRKNDPAYRLRENIRKTIGNALKTLGTSKNRKSSSKYLSYSAADLKSHLENQFESWMNWSNYGIYNPDTWDDNNQSTWTWQVDHIIPQSKFPYTSMEDDNFRKCWALDNLRPLSAKQNIIDGARRNTGKI